MKQEIKNKYTNDVLFTGEFNSLKEALETAIKQSANLQSADLRSANLQSADLRSANLQGANLRSANLQGANLRSANLYDADLQGADLYDADLRSIKNAELTIARTRILPEGNIIGWKKCNNGVIVKLLIPSEAKRSSAFGRKCRAEYVKVLEVLGADIGISSYTPNIIYKIGEIVKPHEWCENFNQECAGGIHFYITKIEAENHS